MDIFDLSRASRIGLAKLRWLEREGWLTGLDDPDARLAPLKHYLARKGELTAPHLVTLIEAPELLKQLGKREVVARGCLRAIGHPCRPAPDAIAAEISEAARGDPEAVARVAAWARSVIPAGMSVTHHWLAVRLLLAVPANLREFEAPRLRRVMLNLRRHKDFVGWWHVEERLQRVTYYHCPKGAFDL